jgi:hypothetical protein
MRTPARSVMLAGLMAGVILWGSAAQAQGTDPLIGTWKLNIAKSTFSPGPPPKSGTVRYEPAAEGMIRTSADLVGADDRRTHIEYAAKEDGKDYPITGAPAIDTVSLKRIDAHTTERIDKKGGKVVGGLTRKLSADGKTLTVTIKSTDPQGKPVSNVVVLEKQ